MTDFEIRESEAVENVYDYSLWVNGEYLVDIGTIQEGQIHGLEFRDNGFENRWNGHFAYVEDNQLLYGDCLEDLRAFHELKDVRGFALTNREFETMTNKTLEDRPLEVESYKMILIYDADDSRPKNGDNGNYDIYAFSVNDEVVGHFENGYHVDKYEDGHGFYDGYNKRGLFVDGGLLYESFEDGDLLVTIKDFNDMASGYEELSTTIKKDLENSLYDRHNLSASKMMGIENKKVTLDSHKYADSDFDF